MIFSLYERSSLSFFSPAPININGKLSRFILLFLFPKNGQGLQKWIKITKMAKSDKRINYAIIKVRGGVAK